VPCWMLNLLCGKEMVMAKPFFAKVRLVSSVLAAFEFKNMNILILTTTKNDLSDCLGSLLIFLA